MRSLMDPPGFWLSSLTKSRHGPVSSRVISTSGVLPISSITLLTGALPSAVTGLTIMSY